MVTHERIEIEPSVWILLSNIETGIKWMIAKHGVGSCGVSSSKENAISDILKSYRLSDSQKLFIRKYQEIKPGEQLELF